MNPRLARLTSCGWRVRACMRACVARRCLLPVLLLQVLLQGASDEKPATAAPAAAAGGHNQHGCRQGRAAGWRQRRRAAAGASHRLLVRACTCCWGPNLQSIPAAIRSLLHTYRPPSTTALLQVPHTTHTRTHTRTSAGLMTYLIHSPNPCKTGESQQHIQGEKADLPTTQREASGIHCVRALLWRWVYGRAHHVSAHTTLLHPRTCTHRRLSCP